MRNRWPSAISPQPLAKFLLKLAAFISVIALLIGLFAPSQVKSVRAECAWGDIICDMQQSMQQLIDNYVTPLKAWVQLQANKALYSLQYSLARTVASFMWGISKMLTTVGVGIGVLNEWIAQSFFTPMIQMTSDTMKPIVGIFLFAAMCILGISYFLAAFIRLNVVSLKSVVVWWFAGALFFSVGPSFYLSMRNLHQALNSLFYASSLKTLQGQNPFRNLSGGDPAVSNPVFKMAPLCSNFGAYIFGSGGNINGLDVALAFQKGDGFDVVNGGERCLGGGPALDVPRAWIGANGFFDSDKAPEGWLGMVSCPPTPAVCDYDGLVQAEVSRMQLSVNLGFAGIAREWQSMPLVWFAVVEQLVALCLIVAQGLTFISFACAILFAFFRRTEPVAWAVVDQWLSLLVQSVVIALMQGMTVALYIAAADSGSPLVTMAASLIALVMMGILLVSGLKAIWSAFNRLFEAFGQASGGVFVSPGRAGNAAVGTAVGAGSAVISGGVSLAAGALSAGGAAVGGMQALGSGATWAQAAGVTFGGSKALDGAAYTIARLPGLRDTSLGVAADQYVEGASLRRVGDELLGAAPLAGGTLKRMGGASLGAALLTDRNPENAEAAVDEQGRGYWKQPLLRNSADNAVGALLSGPTWEPGQAAVVGRGGTPLQEADGSPVRKRDVADEAVNPLNGWGRGTSFTVNNDGDLDETIDADLKRDLRAERETKQGTSSSDGDRLNQTAQKLDEAGSTLRSSADALKQAVQTQTQQMSAAGLRGAGDSVEGRLNVTGANNIAAVMGRTIDQLRAQNVTTGVDGASSARVGAAMADVMGITPVEHDGKPVQPIDGRLNRYQMFADQALRMGVSGEDAAHVMREVKANPDGHLTPDTRERLLRQQHEERGEAWNDSVIAVQTLEHAARITPSAISAYGERAIPPNAQAQIASREPIFLSPTVQGRPGAVIFTPMPSAPAVFSAAQVQAAESQAAAPIRFYPANSTAALDGLNDSAASKEPETTEPPAATATQTANATTQENST